MFYALQELPRIEIERVSNVMCGLRAGNGKCEMLNGKLRRRNLSHKRDTMGWIWIHHRVKTVCHKS
jgi:hypothetical protein